MRAKGYTKETIRLIGMHKRDFPQFEVGDAVEVLQRIKEGEKERLQAFEGDVIAMSNNGISSTFVLRRISSNGVSVERIFPYYSPKIQSIRVLSKGVVRRSKLYYIRQYVGKKARVREKVVSRMKSAAIRETTVE